MGVTGGLQGLNFTARIGTTQLQNDSQQVKSIFRGIGEDVRKMGNNAQSDIDKIGMSVAKIGAAYLSLDFAGRITKEIISVRGEFQQLGIAFETMLGSKEKSDQLMTQQIALAQKTPFTLVDVATNTKQLLAMGIAYEDVMGTMKSLGDVAAGVSVPLSRIAINYGQVATLGKLQQREIRDFAMAGIPIIDELAKNLGRAKDEISGMVEAGQIGFKDVEKAFQTMAGEGGKFYNLMEKQNASVTGQVSNLTDKWQVMLNDIGKSNEGAIYGGISGLASVIENYESIIDILKVLVASLGAYKAATIMVAVHEAAVAKIEATRASIIAGKVAVIKKSIIAEEQAAAATAAATAKEQAAATSAMAIETLKQNAAAKTIAAMEASEIANSQLIAAEERLAAVKGKQIVITNEVAAVETARANLNKAIALENKAITQETTVNANIEAAAVRKSELDKALAKKAGIKLDQDRLIASQTATAAEIRASVAGGFWKTMTTGANPYIIAAIGIAALITALKSFSKESENAGKVSAEFNSSLSKETEEIKKNFKAISDSKDGSAKRAEAIRMVNEKYKDYLPNLLTEKERLEDIKKAQDDVTAAMAKGLAFKAQEGELANVKTNVDEQLKDFYTQIDKSSKKLNDVQKGEFKALIDQYKQQVAESYKALGYFPKNINVDIGDIFSKISGLSFGKGIGGLGITALEMSIKDLILSETELDQKTSGLKTTYESYLEALGLTGKSTGEAGENLITIKKQIEDTKKAITDGENELAEMRSPGSKSTTKDIEEKKAAIEEYKKTLETLTGISQKEKKGVDELKGAQEDLEKAVRSGNKAAIEAAADRVTKLEKEKRALEEIIDLELKRAWRSQFDGQSMTPVQSKGVAPIAKVGQLRMFGGVMQELTEIDKKGNAIWKNRKLETDELAKLVKEKGEKAAKDQKELDEEIFDNKKRFQEDLLNYSRQFTGELIEQLGLTQEQSKEIQGMADTIINLASGNYLAAAFSAASTILTVVTSGQKEDPTTKALENVNDLLEKQSVILANISGTNYFELAAKQYEDYGKSIELNNQKLRDSYIITKEEQAKLLLLPTKPIEYTGTDPLEKAQYKKDLEEYNKAKKDIAAVNAEISAGMKERKNWSPEQFIEAYANGSLILDQQQIDWVKGIVEAQKQRADLLQETFRNALGFDASDVSDSIFQGIEDGLKLGENSLGGFAESFGELMKKALMQAIIDSTNTDITTNFLPKVKEFLQNDEVGPNGEKITTREQLILEGIYSSIVKSGEENSAAVKLVTDKYSSDTSPSTTGQMTGTIKGVTEDTASLIAGQLMAARVDIKDIAAAVKGHGLSLNGMNLSLNEIKGTLSESNNYLFASLNVLKSIDANTGETSSKLTLLSEKVDKTNQLLTNGL